MKTIAKLSATVLHRHYGEHAFAQALAEKELHDLRIITYGVAGNLASMVKYLHNTFLRRAKGSCRVMIGLSNIDSIGSEALAGQIRKLFRHFDPQSGIELFVHGACHIKLLSYRGVSFLGSQNLSGAAEPYFNGIEDKLYFNRFHEALVRIEDPGNACANALFDRVLDDRMLCQRICRRSAAQAYADALIEGVKIDTAASHVAQALQLRAALKGLSGYICLAPECRDRVALYRLLSKIGQASAPHTLVEELFDELYGTDDFAQVKDEALLFRLWSLVHSLNDQLSLHKPKVLELLEEAEALEALKFDAQALEEFGQDLQQLAARHLVTHLQEFVEHQEFAIIQSIMSNPEYEHSYMYGATDEDGNLDHERIERNLCNSELMSLDQKLKRIDPRPILDAIEQCLGRHLHRLHDSSALLQQANALLQDIEQQYQHELQSEEFCSFLHKRNLLPEPSLL
ncbi:hypothetical protein HFV04_019790 [Pseudomonas sp. BIGb0427]|uniref:hypothetical protein n=1 Tax=unclassified Pseudomonas TaxID=196821 RepID=UPI0018A744BB|nr:MULTISPECIES: hypothetical protein [unclassified Pseudomonas]QPG61754.1 hypothetical protein HFV04_019790 [Pseudomonas sp. BIGb0427]UVM69265.1 hypothetical protein LOY34_12285 [Pseudomonas sp. B21-009]